MSLRVAVDTNNHRPNLIPFRGLCGKGLYLPPEYVRLQEYLKKSIEREKLILKSSTTGQNSSVQSNQNDMMQNDYDNNEYNPNCVNNHCQKHNPNQSLDLINNQNYNGNNINAQNLVRPSGTGTALGGEVDGFAADVWMLGVTLLFMITGVKIQDLTLINLFLNKSNSAAQPHKWLGSIPVTVTIEVDDTDSPDDADNCKYTDKPDENKINTEMVSTVLSDRDENINFCAKIPNNYQDGRMDLASSSSSSSMNERNDRNEGRIDSSYDNNRMDLDHNDGGNNNNCEYYNTSQSGQYKSGNVVTCSAATISHSSASDSRRDEYEGTYSSPNSSSLTSVPSSSYLSSSSEHITQGQSQQYQNQHGQLWESQQQQQQQQQQQPCPPRQRKRKSVKQQLPLRVALPSTFDLLSKMLQIDPTQRISLSDVRNHPWLTQDL